MFLVGFPPCNPILFSGFSALQPLSGRFLQGSRPAPRRPLLKKGSIRKLFCGRATYFLWKGKESGMPEPLIFGNWSMDTGRRPLCGCFVLSCMVGGIFRKLLGFRRCLPPARPEKAWPFQAGRSPCTKHPRLSGLAFTHRKKFLRVPRGVFSKTLLGRVWDGVPRGRGGKASHRNQKEWRAPEIGTAIPEILLSGDFLIRNILFFLPQ